MRTISPAVLALLLGCSAARAQVPPAMRNTIDTIPTGWSGRKFELSKDYPATLPTDPKPWKAFDFKTQPREYLKAVLDYGLEGNVAEDWDVQDNAVRKWYHAPGLLASGSGREFIRGLTRERPSRPGELHPNQTAQWSNWAVGIYNPIAAFTVGKVWQDPENPNPAAAKFEDGAVALKLLFTTASVAQVPYLSRTKRWRANVSIPQTGLTSRAPRFVRLLQVDVAVRDDRAAETGWVFGTFMYQNTATGATPYDRLVPVGLMWGNDPDLTKAKFDMGERPQQTWLNKPETQSPHFGRLERLNGPVDNPRSSCLSCHARAVLPYDPGRVAPNSDAEADNPANKFFTNTPAGTVYDGAPAGSVSLDYSLQLAVGLRQFPGGKKEAFAPAKAPKTPEPVEPINFRGGDEEPPPSAPAPLDEGDDTEGDDGGPAAGAGPAPGGDPAPPAGQAPGPAIPVWVWVVLIGAIAVIGGLVWLLSRGRPQRLPDR